MTHYVAGGLQWVDGAPHFHLLGPGGDNDLPYVAGTVEAITLRTPGAPVYKAVEMTTAVELVVSPPGVVGAPQRVYLTERDAYRLLQAVRLTIDDLHG